MRRRASEVESSWRADWTVEEIAGLVWRGRFEDPLQDNYYLESLIKSSLIIQEEGEGEEEEEEGNRRLTIPRIRPISPPSSSSPI